ncbi:MAG TPA: family 1 glycosylhydrolase [Polyangiaceae bacterium]|nr:family 1 glycosylhydrolase [Polyangiaceae bacterium]
MQANQVLSLWGGFECTINRVGDRYHDQLEYSGHDERIEDLDLIADLGIRCLRYPVLWERSEPALGVERFGWADQRLARLQELGIEPIVGLLHHGSGPRYTSLLDPNFPTKLAGYARRVAERYPTLERFTPVNEPLTTARFSGLYGHWYPHGRDDRTFVKSLLNQCKGTCLAMQEIRNVNPGAKLVQTEDMGFTRSTQELTYQAEFDNQRRWLSLDLLAGHVHAEHPLYDYLLDAGASRRDLDFFLEHPCPPDLVGLNYYVTSERFLDGRVELYSPEIVGGNGRDRYVDVEAVRVCADGLLGPTPLLLEASARYGRPVAITEAHLGCASAQQIRWLEYVWNAALAARELGADVRAVTVWALLGAYGWDKLATQGPCSYEAGTFDVSSGVARETPLTHFVRMLARGEAHETEVGWWELEARLLYEPHESESRAA